MCVSHNSHVDYVGVGKSPFVIIFLVLASRFNVSLAIYFSAWLNGSSLVLCDLFFNLITRGTSGELFCEI